MLPIPTLENRWKIKKLPNYNEAAADQSSNFNHWHMWEVDIENKKLKSHRDKGEPDTKQMRQ